MILLQNGTVIDPESGFEKKADILIKGAEIAAIGQNLISDIDKKSLEIIDCSDKIIGPGLVDVHVHFRDPGFTYKENIDSGSEAAKKGGYTSVVLMANTKPPVDTPQTIQYILDKGKKTGINVYTCATITKKMVGQQLNDFKLLKEAGAIGFTDDGIPLLTENIVKQAMNEAAMEDVVLSFHEEDPSFIENNGINHGKASEYFKIGGSNRQAEISMVQRDIALAMETGAKVNFQHISSKETVDLIRQAKKTEKGSQIYTEATPHHIALTEDAAIKYQTLGKMNPPLREEADRQAIIKGLLDNTIDMIATDHAPHSKEEKAKPITEAPSGILGLETAFSVAYHTLVEENAMPLIQLLDKMSYAPAKLYGLNAGSVKINGPADLCIIDTKCKWKIEKFASKSQNSPFLNQELSGKVIMTICKGQIVYNNEQQDKKQ